MYIGLSSRPGEPAEAEYAECTDLAGAGLAYDWRGFSRTVDGNGNQSTIYDTGAVEYLPSPGSIRQRSMRRIEITCLCALERGWRAAPGRSPAAAHRMVPVLE